jgi:hypothetical protein
MNEVGRFPLPEDTRHLYPDLATADGLVNALQAALIEIGSPLTVADLDSRVPFAYALVKSGPRSSQVYIAANERLFLFDFWNRGVGLAQGKTPNLSDAARAISRWVSSSCTTAELASGFAFVAVRAEAAGYERGDEVEQRWQEYMANLGEPHAELVAFVRAAARRPELRQLFPYTSMYTFCFSRCTGYPFTRDIPRVTPLSDGHYEVTTPDGHPLGRGNADAAVELVVKHLPADCGPAVPGTADDVSKASPRI